MELYRFASRMDSIRGGPIGNILKIASKPGIISLAGGLPAPETFPVNKIKNLTQDVYEVYGNRLFQYGMSEGLPELRQTIATYAHKKAISADINNVLICTGAQSALNLIGVLFIDKGDVVGLESPTFLAAVKAFKTYQPDLLGLPMDDEGIIPTSYEAFLSTYNPKFTYIIPNFQNPTGKTMSLQRRHEIIDLAIKYNSLIIEDDPYYELRYMGEHLPSLYSLAPNNVIHTGTLSKVLAPGLRIGYCIASEEITSNLASLKQSSDVHSDHLSQAIAAEYLSHGHLEQQLPTILGLYSKRLDTMIASIQTEFPDISLYKPEGGMFVWLRLNVDLDTESIYETCVQKGVAFVPGKFFYPNHPEQNTMRLNFTNVSEENIRKGIKIIASVLKEYV